MVVFIFPPLRVSQRTFRAWLVPCVGCYKRLIHKYDVHLSIKASSFFCNVGRISLYDCILNVNIESDSKPSFGSFSLFACF